MSRKHLSLRLVRTTDWRREGYRSFQPSQLQLVALLDALIESLTHRPDDGSVLLDGQTIALEDYLEVRPHRREVLADLIQARRIDLGPWYVLPAEFLVGPESLVRNLMIGTRMAADFGGGLAVAYLEHAAGHVAQMPQILRGFGIGQALASHAPFGAPIALWWEAPDGSRVLLIPHQDAKLDLAPSLKSIDARSPILLLVPAQQHGNIAEFSVVAAAIRHTLKRSQVAMNSLADYAADVQPPVDLSVVVGELDSPQWQPLSPGSLSARMWIKQRNHAVETRLVRWAEPFSAWAAWLQPTSGNWNASRLRAPAEVLDRSWRLLLQNHAFPSISGASIDPAQAEMRLRFDHAEQIAEEIASQALVALVGGVDTAAIDGLPVVVFNSSDQSQSDLASAELTLPADWEILQIADESGKTQDAEWSAGMGILGSESQRRASVRFLAEDIPPLGYRTYIVQPGADDPPGPTLDESTTIDNEFLSVELDTGDGTITLFDKRTGRTFGGLSRYVDGGDRGDTYLYCPPQYDTVIDIATNMPLHPERRSSAVEQSVRVLQILRLPHTLAGDRGARLPLTAQFVPVSIWTTYRLKRRVPRVDVEVTVANAALDHRLTVHFPTGIYAQEAFYDGHYEIVRRSIALPGAEETRDWAEQPTISRPQRTFVTILGDDSGLTIANRGLPEVAISSTAHGCEIVLTLLRCVGWMGRTDLPNRRGSPTPPAAIPDAQCLGEHTFAFSIIPHGADPLPAWRQAWAFQDSLRVVPASKHPGILPLSASLVRCDNPLFVISAVKAAQDGNGLIVRGYNIAADAQAVTLEIGLPCNRGEVARLDETSPGERLRRDRKGRYHFEAAPYQIVTLRFT